MSGMEKGIGCLRSEPEQTLREKILANSKTWQWKPPPPKQYRTNERSLGELRHPQAACHACGRSPGQAVGEAGRLFEEKWKTFSDMQKLKGSQEMSKDLQAEGKMMPDRKQSSAEV